MVQATGTRTVDWAAELVRLEHLGAGREPGWLQAARRVALERFLELGLPTTKLEAWKYTSLAPLARAAFLPVLEPDDAPRAKLPPADLPLLADAGLVLVFVDGHLVPELCRTPPSGLRVRALEEVGSEELLLLQEASTPAVDLPAERALEALNAAFARGGTVLEVPAGLEVERVVQLVFAATTGRAARASFPRVLVSAGERSRVRLVESHVSVPGSGASPTFTDALTQVRVARGAVVEHVRLAAQAGDALFVATTDASVAREGRFDSHVLALGAALGRDEVRVTLAGPGAEARLSGLYLADARRHLDCQTFVDHAEPRGSSAQVYRGIADDHGRAVFGGRVLVRPDAQKSDASQSTRSLVLSREASADAKPQLEIHADDVRCAHGATVSSLEDDSLFYLRSRGLDPRAARRLLTLGFADDVLGALPDERLAAWAAALVRRRLERDRSR